MSTQTKNSAVNSRRAPEDSDMTASALLATQNVRLENEDIFISSAELGDASKPTALLANRPLLFSELSQTLKRKRARNDAAPDLANQRNNTMNTTGKYASDLLHPPKPGLLTVVERAMFVRATIVAIVLGTILTLVNQSGWIAGNEPLQVSQLILVFLLPFGVVTAGQIAGAFQAHIDKDGRNGRKAGESIFATLTSHGIPRRSIVISLAFGGTNAVVAIAELLWRSGDLATVSIVPMAQGFVLPLVFGLLSQTISYRRIRFGGQIVARCTLGRDRRGS